MRRKAAVLICLALLGLLFAHAALASGGPGLSPRGPDSPQAANIEDIYWLLVAITGAIFVLVEGALILFIFRFRRRSRARTLEGPQIHGATRLELLWTAIPIVILAVIVTFVLVKLPGINNIEAAHGASALKVNVESRQFYWNFVYPNGVIQVQTLRLPANRPIDLQIGSLDVDHSWWIPALDGKFDAIPGKTNHQHFVPDQPGTYIGQCGEFCGYEHPHMVGKVKVVDSSEFDAWLQRQQQAQQNGTSDLGKQTWQGVCATCHGLAAKGGFGPALVGNPILAQPGAIETLVRNGRNKMPAVGRGWSDTQMKALIAYVKRFKGGSSGG